MGFEYLIAFRYLYTRRNNGFISFISLVSVLGIGLGVAALIVVLSVMNGFQKEIRARMLGAVSHVEITSMSGALSEWSPLAKHATTLPEVVGAAPFVQAQGLLSVGEHVRGTLIRGVLPPLEPQVVDIASQMVIGSLNDLQAGRFGMILGVELARSLGVRVGDKVTLITPQGQVTPIGMMPRLKQFTVVGVFKMGMFEYDASFAMIHLHDAQVLFRLGERVSGVRLRLTDSMLASSVNAVLSQQFEPPLLVSDWTEQNATYFKAVQLEKRMMFIILTLIVAVAAFNLVSTLVMVVTDKRADIAILRTLGATPSAIMKIFMVQGGLSGVLGVVLGVLGGVGLAANIGDVVHAIEAAWGMQLLSSEVYMLDRLPSDVQWSDVVTIAIIALSLAFLATLYPSWRAARTQPAEALRYE